MTPRILFRTLAIAEAITWTLLIAGMVIAYGFDGTRLGISIGGGLHGFVFLAYVVAVAVVAVNQRWHWGVTLVGLVSAIVPYATIPFDVWADRTGRLDGDWRREAGDDPRDQRWVERMLRLALARPVTTVVLGVVGVAVVFSALLVIGPPGGRS